MGEQLNLSEPGLLLNGNDCLKWFSFFHRLLNSFTEQCELSLLLNKVTATM